MAQRTRRPGPMPGTVNCALMPRPDPPGTPFVAECYNRTIANKQCSCRRKEQDYSASYCDPYSERGEQPGQTKASQNWFAWTAWGEDEHDPWQAYVYGRSKGEEAEEAEETEGGNDFFAPVMINDPDRQGGNDFFAPVMINDPAGQQTTFPEEYPNDLQLVEQPVMNLQLPNIPEEPVKEQMNSYKWEENMRKITGREPRQTKATENWFSWTAWGEDEHDPWQAYVHGRSKGEEAEEAGDTEQTTFPEEYPNDVQLVEQPVMNLQLPNISESAGALDGSEDEEAEEAGETESAGALDGSEDEEAEEAGETESAGALDGSEDEEAEEAGETESAGSPIGSEDEEAEDAEDIEDGNYTCNAVVINDLDRQGENHFFAPVMINDPDGQQTTFPEEYPNDVQLVEQPVMNLQLPNISEEPVKEQMNPYKWEENMRRITGREPGQTKATENWFSWTAWGEDEHDPWQAYVFGGSKDEEAEEAGETEGGNDFFAPVMINDPDRQQTTFPEEYPNDVQLVEQPVMNLQLPNISEGPVKEQINSYKWEENMRRITGRDVQLVEQPVMNLQLPNISEEPVKEQTNPYKWEENMRKITGRDVQLVEQPVMNLQLPTISEPAGVLDGSEDEEAEDAGETESAGALDGSEDEETEDAEETESARALDGSEDEEAEEAGETESAGALDDSEDEEAEDAEETEQTTFPEEYPNDVQLVAQPVMNLQLPTNISEPIDPIKPFQNYQPLSDDNRGNEGFFSKVSKIRNKKWLKWVLEHAAPVAPLDEKQFRW